MEKDYCTQNNGDCISCSLSNYVRDCRNNSIEDEKSKENFPTDNGIIQNPLKSKEYTAVK